MTKKPIPKGKKGKGIRALKKKAPKVAKAMGYKKGGKAQWLKIHIKLKTDVQLKKVYIFI